MTLVYDAGHANAEAQVENVAKVIGGKFRQKLDDNKNPGAHVIEFRYCEAVSDEVLSYKQSPGVEAMAAGLSEFA
ncbi:MAG: hypothetical protein ACYDEV_14935 [Acidiferrobacter sp.]